MARRSKAPSAPEQRGLLQAILANPYDDAPRLVYADWLEEHGQPQTGEFIRVQCELEPIRGLYEIDRAAELHAREAKLEECRQAQLAPLKELLGLRWRDAPADVRRGFLYSVSTTAADFLELGAGICAACPTLRRVQLFCVNGYAARLAACEHLRGLPELELSCWYTPGEARVLTESPHLGDLEVLVVWLGGRSWQGAIRSFELVRLFASSSAWPNLRELTLFDPGSGEDAEGLVENANEAAGRKLARVVQGLDGRLPFAGNFAYFCPGKFPDGRRLVAKPIGDAIHVIVFGADDRVAEAYDVPQTKEVRAFMARERGLYGARPEFRDAIHRAVGSAPAFIRVFPFGWPDGYDNPVEGPEYHHEKWSALGLPDDPDEDTREDPFGFGGEINWIVETGQFGCGNGWCDNRGRVHST
jgi:uncharacterized protein (TIGR02996 family)